MKKRLALLLALFSLLFLPSLAMGQIVTHEESFQTPRWFYFEFKLGPYSPNVDQEFIDSGSDARPFAEAFGDGSSIMFNWELDVEIYKAFGTLGIGAAFGYYSLTEFAKIDKEASTSAAANTSDVSASENSFKIMPLSLLAVYRFDWPADHLGIPIVPFVKFGVNYSFWWSSLDGNTSTYKDENGKVLTASGGTWGWQFNAGVALRLDVLEPQAAKNLDVELGINHTYLFLEFAHIAANGLGSSKALMLGDTTWDAGIAFEF